MSCWRIILVGIYLSKNTIPPCFEYYCHIWSGVLAIYLDISGNPREYNKVAVRYPPNSRNISIKGNDSEGDYLKGD